MLWTVYYHVEVYLSQPGGYHWEHYSCGHVKRKYGLFEILAGLCNGTEPPDDATLITKLAFGLNGTEQLGLLSPPAVQKLEQWQDKHVMPFEALPPFGYLFDGYIGTWHTDQEDEECYPDKIRAVRVIYWFDERFEAAPNFVPEE